MVGLLVPVDASAGTVTRRVMLILAEKVAEIDMTPRYQDASYGEWVGAGEAAEYRFIERGGLWNDTSNRAAEGYTKADVVEVRRALKRWGVNLSTEDVDALVMQALHGSIRVTYSRNPALAPIKSPAERKREQRDRARAAGLCVMNPHHGLAGNGFKTCEACRHHA